MANGGAGQVDLSPIAPAIANFKDAAAVALAARSRCEAADAPCTDVHHERPPLAPEGSRCTDKNREPVGLEGTYPGGASNAERPLDVCRAQVPQPDGVAHAAVVQESYADARLDQTINGS